MELLATSIDGFLAYWFGLNDVSGEIHSVFQQALNIRTSGGQLVSILSGADLAGPNTVLTELPEGMDFISMGLRSGMPVRLQGTQMQLGDGDLRLRTGTARKWWPRLADGLESVDMGRLETNLRAVDREISEMSPGRGLGVLLSSVTDMATGRWEPIAAEHFDEMVRRALPALRDLMTGFLGQDDPALQRGVEGLIGLGSGLTPSGDDVLLGFIGALGAVSKRVNGPEMESILESLCDHVYGNRHRTTFISTNILAFACAGRMAAPVLNVIRAFLFEETDALLDSVKVLLRQGDASGSEVLLGILLALSPLPHLER